MALLRGLPSLTIGSFCGSWALLNIFDQALLEDRLRPRVVSIGSYYHWNPLLQPMKDFKWQCLAYSLKKSNKKLEDYMEKIWELDQFRECYSESSGLQPDEFLAMMVLDGCFIVEFIRFSYSSSKEEKPEQSAMKSHPLARMEMANILKIRADLLMLRNQIPFRVLEQIFEVSKINLAGEPRNLSTLCLKYFSAILGFPRFRNSPEADLARLEADWMHLLRLVRSIFISPNYEGRSPLAKETPLEVRISLEYQYKPYATIPCITKLRRKGIKVKVNPRREDGLLINFNGGVIEMPKIILNDSMCSFLENCVTLEQHYNVRPKCFSVYALCLDCLVNTAADVEYLCECKVIENYLETDKEAATFFNRLGKDLKFDCDYFNNFFRLCHSVNQYSGNRCRQAWTKFKMEYFDKPWLWISILAAAGLFILTLMQTYCAMYALVHPKN